jgi:hypothetical protein
MMASGWRRAIGIACGVLFFAACSENADLFSSLDESAQPELSTVKAGSVMGGGDPVEVQIEYPSDEASRATFMRVELQDAEGAVHGSVEFDQEALAEPRLPTVTFAEPPEGVYVLATEAWIHDQPLFSDRRQLFVTSVPPRIESVTIHPTSIRREMQALAVADVDHTGSTRPYLRWIFDDGVAAEGYLEDGLGRTILDGAGRNVGAYRVTLEVYPWGIDEGAQIDGSTTITADSDVVVREELEPASPDFASMGPGRVVRYFSFDGTRQAWTESSGELVEASVDGDVFLDLNSGALGVRIPPESAVSAPVPTPEDATVVSLVTVRLSTSNSTAPVSDAPVVSPSVADHTGESLSITVEDGAFMAYPVGSAPIRLSPSSEEDELVTLRFLLENRNGATYLESAIDDATSTRPIRLGAATQDLSVTLRGSGDQQLFLDRITVTELAAGELRTERVQRATRRFVQSFDDRLGAWAVTVPDNWTTVPSFQGEYPDPGARVEIGDGTTPFIHTLLPDGGGLVVRATDPSLGSVTLRRRGDLLEAVSGEGQGETVSRVEIPEATERLEFHRLVLSRAATALGSSETAHLRAREDDQGAFISLNLPETLRNAPLVIIPEASEAEYPVWVGRWAP